LKHDTKDPIVELEEHFLKIQRITSVGEEFLINFLKHI